MPQYEIYALKYAGPFTRTGAHLMWYRDWDKIEQINYYIWKITRQLPVTLRGWSRVFAQVFRVLADITLRREWI
jgi:hypothetical protein